ncbi:SIS domain-containing protein [Actinokineospora xionganensis]|uniref:Glutamine--fructose-6-phosphate aminotransferase [isomerizing] n=1 Tax=Actinokineospora xionganensis TaxID=2684470 RepID=A0ABR7LDF7_9PSEU|nr:SIS domain-containing protein [Actinokineospora xionganensis]
MSASAEETSSQPECWIRAADAVAQHQAVLPREGERVAVTGCGTSWFVAMAYASLREGAGHGTTDAFAASEFPVGRTDYDRVIVITRSGTTTEVLTLLEALRGGAKTVAITATEGSPVTKLADHAIELPFIDERSVVQTRSATSVLALLRASLGEDLTKAVADAREALTRPLGDLPAADQVTFLGQGWTVGLAHEAALKLREAAQVWTESYPAMEYRHGPVSIAEPGRLTWVFGPAPEGLPEDVAATGATFVTDDLDPMAQLVLAHRLALAIAERKGLDPDSPRNLTRSVILAATGQ